MSETPFQTVFRGYDPVAVEQAIQSLKTGQASAVQEAAQKSVEITKLQSANDALANDLANMRVRLEEAERAPKDGTAPTYADLGPRISQILALAEEEAADIINRASYDAEEAISFAAKGAEEAKAQAELYAAETKSRVDAQAAKIVELAKREADDIVDHAEREASARRGEAEALFESQRAKSAAAAADFEKTLATRRDKAATEFQTLMAGHQASIAAAEERLANAQAEAKRVLDEATTEATQLRESAKAEASHVLETARANAERVRRDSERELAALASRRDSITGQLANVRQMLATLGGASLSQMDAVLSSDDEPTTSAE